MGNGLLQGKKGIIFGALDENSIAWKVALRAKAEGARFTLSNTNVAMRYGKVKELGKLCETEVIAADATNVDDLKRVFERSVEFLGGKVDFVLHSIGMSLNIRKKRPYTTVNYHYYQKTLDISAFSFHKILQTAFQEDAIAEWGSVVALSFIAAQRAFPGYNDMADAKAVLESIARNFGYHYGKKRNVRINTVSQSPTPTTAGTSINGFSKFYNHANDLAPLGNASGNSCADFCVLLFSDYARMLTMQNIYHDGGFSSVGINTGNVQYFQEDVKEGGEQQIEQAQPMLNVTPAAIPEHEEEELYIGSREAAEYQEEPEVREGRNIEQRGYSNNREQQDFGGGGSNVYRGGGYRGGGGRDNNFRGGRENNYRGRDNNYRGGRDNNYRGGGRDGGYRGGGGRDNNYRGGRDNNYRGGGRDGGYRGGGRDNNYRGGNRGGSSYRGGRDNNYRGGGRDNNYRGGRDNNYRGGNRGGGYRGGRDNYQDNRGGGRYRRRDDGGYQQRNYRDRDNRDNYKEFKPREGYEQKEGFRPREEYAPREEQFEQKFYPGEGTQNPPNNQQYVDGENEDEYYYEEIEVDEDYQLSDGEKYSDDEWEIVEVIEGEGEAAKEEPSAEQAPTEEEEPKE